MNTLKKFDAFNVTEFPERNTNFGKTFYKIIDKGKEETWLNKDFIPNKKTMVTTNKDEIFEINPQKTAVVLSNVPDECIIDNEGKWSVIEPFMCKDKINVEPFN